MHELKNEVRTMREKMRNHLAINKNEQFDLKQSRGGIADIEFIVQFHVLAHAAEFPSLSHYTDNIRLLESLDKAALISHDDAETLKKAYCLYRDYGHKQGLQGDAAIIDETQVHEIKIHIEKIWHQFME
jgi:glutamate-ammonia-ligase adenylyltransferase